MSEQKTLRELFSTTYFRVPDFQRGYAWSTRQLDDLWSDLDSLPENAPHYMGTLFVERGFKRAESDQWVEDGSFVGVVDGQQRLTTLAILLFVLMKHSEGRGYARQSVPDLMQRYVCTRDNAHPDVASYKFCYDETSNTRDYRDFLVGTIFEDAAVRSPSINSVYAKNLVEAKRFFEEKVLSLDYPHRERLFRTVTGRLCFDYREIDGDFDVQMVFETLNNRGKPLTTLEKLKNRLMYLSARLDVADHLKIGLQGKSKTSGDESTSNLRPTSTTHLTRTNFSRPIFRSIADQGKTYSPRGRQRRSCSSRFRTFPSGSTAIQIRRRARSLRCRSRRFTDTWRISASSSTSGSKCTPRRGLSRRFGRSIHRRK